MPRTWRRAIRGQAARRCGEPGAVRVQMAGPIQPVARPRTARNSTTRRSRRRRTRSRISVRCAGRNSAGCGSPRTCASRRSGWRGWSRRARNSPRPARRSICPLLNKGRPPTWWIGSRRRCSPPPPWQRLAAWPSHPGLRRASKEDAGSAGRPAPGRASLAMMVGARLAAARVIAVADAARSAHSG